MPRRARQAPGGIVYHVINRGAGRLKLFSRAKDYEAFERVMEEALERHPMRVLSYCLMPNHWHLVLWPRGDGDLSRFMFWLTMTHTQRWRHARRLVGLGPLYQGRFKAFPVETDEHFLTLCSYVERNPLRAGLTERAEQWQWSSLWRRLNGDASQRGILAGWPVEAPRNWVAYVNRPENDEGLESIRTSVRRSRPFGGEQWQRRIAVRLGLEASFRPRGRPRLKPRGTSAGAGK